MADFSAMLGRTIRTIVNSAYEITFICADGAVFRQHHSQDCCESVTVDEIHGDLEDLIDTPVLLAEEVTYDNTPEPGGKVGSDEEYCWTFYKLATLKGHVTIRWLGESNGYYSTAVEFDEVKP